MKGNTDTKHDYTMKALISDFILESFNDFTKFVIVRAGRRSGKTYNAVIWICLMLLNKPGSTALWVDTTQLNLKKYVVKYFKPILGDIWNSCHYNAQMNMITFPNGSILEMGSAQRPELLEGFEYDYGVINEAGIIFKMKPDLWDNTLRAMFKGPNTLVKIIGTPKGKRDKNAVDGLSVYNRLSVGCEGRDDWVEYVYSSEESPHWDQEELIQIKQDTPPAKWKQEYLALFTEGDESGIVKHEMLRHWDTLPSTIDTVYLHADTTHTGKTTSDYFALGAIGQCKVTKKFYLVDYLLEKMDVEAQAKASIQFYQKIAGIYRVAKFTYDEKANQGFGFWVKKMAREDYGVSLPIQELKYPNDKMTHFEPHFPHFVANRVYFPNVHKRREELIAQVTSFPDDTVNDDGIDMISGCMDNYDKPKFTFYSGF